MVLAVFSLVAFVGCPKKQAAKPSEVCSTAPKSPEVGPGPGAVSADAEDAAKRQFAVAKQEFESEHVHFDFDKSNLRPDAQEILRKKAAFLRSYADVNILVAGHCDERGSVKYNLALGDRRAQSAKKFLVDLGLSANRMSTVSYGKEKPVDPGHNETAWAKNRRDEFSVK